MVNSVILNLFQYDSLMTLSTSKEHPLQRKEPSVLPKALIRARKTKKLFASLGGILNHFRLSAPNDATVFGNRDNYTLSNRSLQAAPCYGNVVGYDRRGFSPNL